jgi:hypothetical protein
VRQRAEATDHRGVEEQIERFGRQHSERRKSQRHDPTGGADGVWESAKRALQRRNYIVDRPGRRIAGGELMATAAELRCDRSEIE